MNSIEIRQKFLNFFKKNGHTIVPSSSLIPAQDPTLLFTNAGMNQFKDVFLGKEKRSYNRATSIQKCVRAGGKHNDLEQVGFTPKHLTFFEMMGNFSFGDYFKKEAIQFAWLFLTKEMNLNPKELVVSVYKTDDEAFEIWNKLIGVPEEKIFRLGEEDNFWQMGPTGPCGPCSEIHLDTGKSCSNPNCNPSCDCGKYLEIWNLVFMQFNRSEDGKLTPLKKTGIDTGMGFERLCMIKQNKESIFQTDVFMFLINKIEQLTKKSYKKSNQNLQAAFHVLSDHVRSSSLLIADGCTPSNEGRGYVLRKIIRRAALFAQKLTSDNTFFTKLAQEFINKMSDIFPELKTEKTLILKLLQQEINRFSANLIAGQSILDKILSENKKEKKDTLTGPQIFKLYDTYGFPPELTKIIAKENKFDVDMKGFETEMKKQQEQSGKKEKTEIKLPEIPQEIETKFIGYENLENESEIIFLQKGDDFAWIATEQTPFYVESGGQISDIGFVTINGKTFPVQSLQKINNAIALKIKIEKDDKISKNDVVKSTVDNFTRINSGKNHTATHLLQAALKQIVGGQIKQAGSLVDEKHLRFDFTHHEGLTSDQIEKIEQLVNQKIQENIEIKTFYTTLQKAKDSGVTAIFGEKYNPENVRVVQVAGFSAELCGGTHLKSTGEVGCFKITNESALSTGIRRIFAVTGPQALKLFQQNFNTIKKLSEKYKAKPKDVLQAVEKQEKQFAENLKQLKKLKRVVLKSEIPTWIKKIEKINNIPFLFLELQNLNNQELKDICIEITNKQPAFVFTLCKNKEENKLNFVALLDKSVSDKIDLKKLALYLKDNFQIKGGGNPTFIQGGGKITQIDLKEIIINWIKQK